MGENFDEEIIKKIIESMRDLLIRQVCLTGTPMPAQDKEKEFIVL
jgi:hypothetical protein